MRFDQKSPGFMRRAFGALFWMIAFLISPSLAGAQGNMELGPVKVLPTLGLRGEHTDNLFLESGLTQRSPAEGGSTITRSAERSDFLTTLSPGLLLKLPIRNRHFFQVQYRAELPFYLRYHKHNTTDHHLGGALELHFPGGLDVKLAHRLAAASNPPDFETVQTRLDGDGRVVGRTRREDRRADYLYNVSAAEVAYAFANRYKASLNYSRQDQGYDWKADREDDFKQDEVWANLSYRVLPKTSVLLEPGLSFRDNTDRAGPSTDNAKIRLWLGLHWDPTAKLNGTLKGGYIRQTFEESEGGKDSDDIGFSIDLTYHLSHKTLIGLNGYRYILDTTNRRGAPLGGAPAQSIGGEEGTDLVSDQGNQTLFGSQYVATRATLSLRHRLTHKIAGLVGATLHTNRYKESGVVGRRRQDDRFGADLALEYQVQDWLLLKLGYSYVDASSNIRTEEYEENRFLAQCQLAF